MTVTTQAHQTPALVVTYDLLVGLYEQSPHQDAVDYASLLPQTDSYQLRNAASWLVENGYARWGRNVRSLTITDAGRAAVSAALALIAADLDLASGQRSQPPPTAVLNVTDPNG